MSLLDQIIEDVRTITGNPDEFGREISFEAPTGETAVIVGLHTKHHMGIDTDGIRVNSKNAHVSFSEKLLADKNYPVRNASGEVSLERHLVTVKDSTGNAPTYVIREWYPDETLGLIVCILGDFS